MPPPAPPQHLRTLVIGGARSGKSAYAERIVAEPDSPVRYVATARRDASDHDFERRIAAHHARRPGGWTVVESADRTLAALLRDDDPAPTLVDDIGTWLTSVIDDAGAWELPRGSTAEYGRDLVSAVSGYRGRLVLVTPEVGQGVIPASRSGRLFRDELGSLNQQLAAACDEVQFVVAGLPLRLK